MHPSRLVIGRLLAALALATPAACSLAGLDDYVGHAGSSGSGGSGGASSGASSSTSSGASSGASSSTSSGSCGATCSAGCVDLSSDPANCGACGVACAGGYGCSQGVCDNVPVALSEGFSPMCVVLHGGEVWCWGRNNWGQTGTDPLDAAQTITTDLLSTNCVPAPARVPGITDAVEVSTSSTSTCARTVGGKILCWGGNPDGTLGHAPGMGDATCTKLGGGGPDNVGNGAPGPCSLTPVEVPLPAGFVPARLVSGPRIACARSVGGDVLCWGTNGNGEIQAPPSPGSLAPRRSDNVNGNAAQLHVSGTAEGWATLCVVRAGSALVDCWGAASATSTNDGIFSTVGVSGCAAMPALCDPVARSVPLVFANPSAGFVMADSVQAGYVAGCALRQGVVTCWGDNDFGQRGDGSAGAGHFDPTPVPGLPPVATLSMKLGTVAALDTSGGLWTWGWNDQGQTGDGSVTGASCHSGGFCATTPKKVLDDVARVSMGINMAAAITRDGKVLTWGANYFCEQGHAPSAAAGDVPCAAGSTLFCNPTPKAVEGLP